MTQEFFAVAAREWRSTQLVMRIRRRSRSGCMWPALVGSVLLVAQAADANVVTQALTEQDGIVLHWTGQCTDPVAIVPGTPAAREALRRASPDMVDRVAEAARRAARQRCPAAADAMLGLPTGARMLPLRTDARETGAAASRGASSGAAAPVAAAPAATTALPADSLLQPRSSLRGPASGKGEGCVMLADWLDAFQAQPLEGFRDEHMQAVFGQTYDEGGPAWRAQAYSSLFVPCLTVASKPAAIGPLAWLQPKASAEESATARRLQRHATLLSQAFNNFGGSYSAPAITAFLRQVREHYGRGQALVTLAAASTVEPAALARLDPQGAELKALVRLTAEDRERLTRHLAERHRQLVPVSAQAWISSLEGLPRNLATAAELKGKAADLAALQAALPAEQAQALATRHAALLEACLQADVAPRVARLPGTPATVEGARSLVAWEAEFDAGFAAYGASPAVLVARKQLSETRERVLAALLPGWQSLVARAEPADVEARRGDLAALFGAAGERASPQYAAFKAPLVQREAVLRQRQDAEDQLRLKQLAKNPVAAGPKLADLRLPGGAGGKALAAIFEGRFDRAGLQPASLDADALVHGYIIGYSASCKAQLRDPVELKDDDCEAWTVRKHGGMEVSRTCTRSRAVSTGVFAERSLKQATEVRRGEQAMDLLKWGAGMFKRSVPMSQPLMQAANVEAMQAAGVEAGRSASCGSAAQERLRVNLEHFLHGRPPKLLESQLTPGVALLPAAPGQPYRDSDYERLVRDLMTVAASDWAGSRYPASSVHGVRVVSRDGGGRPTRVHAQIRIDDNPSAALALIFEEGRPICIYTSDARGQCRSPATELVQAYVEGQYR